MLVDERAHVKQPDGGQLCIDGATALPQINWQQLCECLKKQGGNQLVRRLRLIRRTRQRIDHLARPRVMQLFASLMLNRIRVILQPHNMVLQPIVLTLQLLHLDIQSMGLLPLLLIYSQPIRPKHDVIPNADRKHCRSTPSQPSAGSKSSTLGTHAPRRAARASPIWVHLSHSSQ